MGDALPIRTRSTYNATANASTTTLPAYTPAAPKPINSAELDAHFVKDVVADGTSFNPDSEFTQTWTLRNPGPHAWPAGIAVCNIGGDNMLNLDRTGYTTVFDLNDAKKSNSTTQTVAVGQTHEFSVNMRAPTRNGKHISYWRLKAADGTPFGHKLWCDIEVSNKTNAAPAKETEEEQPARGQQDILSDIESTMRGVAMRSQFGSVYAQAAAQDLSGMQATVEDADESSELRESQMVMPTLERDGTPSASNSMHSIKVESVPESVAVTETKSESDAGTVATEDKVDELSDMGFESADAGSEKEDADDDGFLTDEEYDILDASDEEGRF